MLLEHSKARSGELRRTASPIAPTVTAAAATSSTEAADGVAGNGGRDAVMINVGQSGSKSSVAEQRRRLAMRRQARSTTSRRVMCAIILAVCVALGILCLALVRLVGDSGGAQRAARPIMRLEQVGERDGGSEAREQQVDTGEPRAAGRHAGADVGRDQNMIHTRKRRGRRLSLLLDGVGFPAEEDFLPDIFGQVGVVLASRTPLMPWPVLRQLLWSAASQCWNGSLGSEPILSTTTTQDAAPAKSGVPAIADLILGKAAGLVRPPISSKEMDAESEYLLAAAAKEFDAQRSPSPQQHLRNLEIVVVLLKELVPADAAAAAQQWCDDILREVRKQPGCARSLLISRIRIIRLQSIAQKTAASVAEGPAVTRKNGDNPLGQVIPGIGAMFNRGVEFLNTHLSHVFFAAEAYVFDSPPLRSLDLMLGTFTRHATSSSSSSSISKDFRHRRIGAVQLAMLWQVGLCSNSSGHEAAPAAECAAGQRTVADKGLHIGMGTERLQPKVFVVRRLMGLPPRDARVRGAVDVVDMVGPLGTMIDLRKFVRIDGFVERPGLLDRVVSDMVDTNALKFTSDVVKFRIFTVERVMESISLNEVHAAGAELRQLVRTTYAEVVDATAVWEEVTQRVFDTQSYDFEGSDLERQEKAETRGFKAMSTLQRLRISGQRLHDAVLALRSSGRRRDSTGCDDSVGWEMSLQLRSSGISVLAMNVTMALVQPLLPPAFNQFLAANGLDVVLPSYAMSGALERDWGAAARRWFSSDSVGDSRSGNSGDGSSPLRVVWDTICCGCCGFSTEIANFVYPLEKRRLVSVFPSFRSCFCAGYPAAVADTLQRIHITPDQYILQKRAQDEMTVWIAHTDPLAYKTTVQSRRLPDYIVGRSMYEFSRVQHRWVSHAKNADEIWVPAEFVRRIFIDSGIPSEKLVIVPEAVDTHYFDPKLYSKFELPPKGQINPAWRHFCNVDASELGGEVPFKFFSNFKWEPRKGWDLLFEAYFDAFARTEQGALRSKVGQRLPVSLYILTYVFVGSHYQGDIHNLTHIQQELQEMVETRLPAGTTLADLPHFCIISETVKEEDLARLYNSIDAFVLPTRGEGWGLPAIQAMAMAKPTISTNWGGSTEFMKRHNSFLIPLDAVEEIPHDSPYGWELGKKWATPSVSALASIMKYVTANPEHAARVGRRARRYIERRFSLDAIAELTDSRLHQIRNIVLERRRKLSYRR